MSTRPSRALNNYLDREFWTRFARTYWEKKSATFKNVRSPLLDLNEGEVFQLLIRYSDRCRRRKSAAGLKLYIEGHRQFESEVLRHLPRKGDRSFAGYHERMQSQYSDYCLVCDELLQVTEDRQELLKSFLRNLFDCVGVPNRFAEMGLYLGNYRKTPFGVHEDACGVFSFPLVGKKKFRIWSANYLKKNPGLAQTFKYSKYKQASMLLEARPGDMTYWPSSAWHIAESDGSFSATWSLGVWVDKPYVDTVTEMMKILLDKCLGSDADLRLTNIEKPASRSGEVASLPDLYVRTLNKIKNLSKSDFETVFCDAWMKHSSRDGLKESPVFDITINRTSVLKLRSATGHVRWMQDSDETIFAFNGSSIRSSSKALFKFITALNAGEKSRVPKGQLADVQVLARAGAFSIELN